MIAVLRKPSLRREFFLHAIFWMLYIVIVYIVNIIRYRATDFLQCLGGIPLIMIVFYLSFHFVKSKKILLYHKRILLLFIPSAILFFLFCDYWIYKLLPKINIRISNYEDRNTIEFAINYLQYLIKYIFYGSFFAVLDLLNDMKRLEVRLLLKGIDPHFNFNAWNEMLARVGGNIKDLLTFVSGHIALQLYIIKIQKMDQDFIAFEMELAKIRSWAKTLDRDIHIDVTGEPNGQYILPMAGIELLSNALKYSPANTPIAVLFSLKADGLVLRIQNQTDHHSTALGLGSGIKDLRTRIALNPILKGNIEQQCLEGIYTVNLNLKSKK